jgi:hypothetical protein
MVDQTFADVTWQSRWNPPTAMCAALSQSGSHIVLFTALGTVNFDLTKSEDVEAFCVQMQHAIDMVRRARRDYDIALRSA